MKSQKHSQAQSDNITLLEGEHIFLAVLEKIYLDKRFPANSWGKELSAEH